MGNPRNANGAARRALRRRVAAVRAPCWICGLPIDYDLPARHPHSYELDELVPVSNGGDPLDPANVAPAHRICNQWRCAKSVAAVERTRAAARAMGSAWTPPRCETCRARRDATESGRAACLLDCDPGGGAPGAPAGRSARHRAFIPPPVYKKAGENLEDDLLDFELPDFDGLGDLDFSLDGFDVLGEPDGITTRTMSKPKYRIPQKVTYEHAREFARDIAFERGMSCFAIVSGNFIFGDFVEALADMGKIDVRSMTIQTLSMSEENIDSLVNIIETCDVERVTVVLSDYWYSHERRELVPYLHDELTRDGMETRIAYASCHTKIWNIETWGGNKLTIHGSANMRSSRNIEQIQIDQCDELYDFVEEFTDRIVEKYAVVNEGAKRPRSLRGENLWQAVASEAEAAEEAAGSCRRPRSAGCRSE